MSSFDGDKGDDEIRRQMHFDFVRKLQERIETASVGAYHAGCYAKNVHANKTLNLRLQAILDGHRKELEGFLYNELPLLIEENTTDTDPK